MNGAQDDFDWLVGTGPTPTLMTGPHRDHTLNNDKGHYMYIDSNNVPSGATFRGSKAWLLTLRAVNTAFSRNCRVRFWLFMNGIDVDQFNVYRMRYSTGNPNQNGEQITPNICRSPIVVPFKGHPEFKSLTLIECLYLL